MTACYQTFCIKKGGVNVATFCSFNKEVSAWGDHWDIHKGRLQLAHDRVPTKVIVKVCPDPGKSHQECEAEIRKMDFVEDILKKSPELRRFKVCKTYKTEVDEVCATCSLKFSSKPGSPIQEGTPVIVQDRTEGVIRALDIEAISLNMASFEEISASSDDISMVSNRRRSRSEGSESWRDLESLDLLFNLAKASYQFSHGTKVITGIKVVKFPNSRKSRYFDDSRSAKYMLTSVTIHSDTQEFGCKDRGMDGIQEFLEIMNKTGRADFMQDGTRRRMPSAPPLENEDAFQNCVENASPQLFLPAGIPTHFDQVFGVYANLSPNQELTRGHTRTPELMTKLSETGDGRSSRNTLSSGTGGINAKLTTRRAESAGGPQKVMTKNAEIGESLLKMMTNRSNSVDKTRFNPFSLTAPSTQLNGGRVGGEWANFAGFDFPPAYESIVFGGHESGDAPPPYTETLRDPTFILGS